MYVVYTMCNVRFELLHIKVDINIIFIIIPCHWYLIFEYLIPVEVFLFGLFQPASSYSININNFYMPTFLLSFQALASLSKE